MTRRCVLQAPLLPLAAARAVPTGRIQRLETFVVRVNHRGNWILVRVSTDGGANGIGDASHGAADEAQLALVRKYFDRLRGRSVFDLETARRDMLPEIKRDGRPGAVAWSAIEQCLWDIRGKMLGVPVFQLLGGAMRESIRCYANINRCTTDRTPAGFAASAKRAVAARFDAIKLAPFDGMPRKPKDESEWHSGLGLGVDCAAAVREVLGPGRDLLIDVHNHCDLPHALDLARRFEPMRLFWLEETCPAFGDLAAVNRAAPMPTAGGENLFGVAGFYPYVAAGAVDIVMPDVKYCGGLWEMKKIGALAEGAGLQVSPHGPASPVGNVAAAHVCATLPNFLILEHAFGECDWREELIEPAERIVSGRLTLTSKPGFGIALNEPALRRHAA